MSDVNVDRLSTQYIFIFSTTVLIPVVSDELPAFVIKNSSHRHIHIRG